MNAHIEAWNHVKEHIFGSVCEVTREIPWGFKEDMSSIHNVSVDEFLKTDDKFDTIILHILLGEGECEYNFLKVLNSAYSRCIKLIILEHNPEHEDFPDFDYDLRFINNFLEDINELCLYENWGRNCLYACTTMSPLHLPQLNDKYYKDNIDKTFVIKGDKGTDPKHLIYTHTSESPIDFKLPLGKIWWIAGGGLPFESMKEINYNIVIDSVLRQCIHWAMHFEQILLWKLKRLYDLSNVSWKKYQEQDSNPEHWRAITPNGIIPNSIQHISLQDLHCEGDTVYVSTVHKDYWKHLIKDNNIIDAWTERDKPQLMLK